MLLATTAPAPAPLTQQEQILYGSMIGLLFMAAVFVFIRMYRRVVVKGPLTRPDLLASPEILVGGIFFVLFMLNLFALWFGTEPAEPPSAAPPRPLEELIGTSMLWMLIPVVAIAVTVIIRGGHLRNIWGLDRCGPARTIGLGFCLAVLAVPLTLAANAVTVNFLGGEGAPQVLVQQFKIAVNGGNWQLVSLIAVSACVVAPITEEVLFRGTFYPMLARSFGRAPSAIFTSVFFAAVHDKLAILPGLTLLALCLTLAFEFTGSLLVPIVMHMVFNAISLLVMWLQVNQGFTP